MPPKPDYRSSQLPTKVPSFFALLLGFVFANVLWHGASLLLKLPVLPTPLSVYAAYPQALENGIFTHACASSYRMLSAILFSLLAGGSLGILTGVSVRANLLLSPLLYFSYPLPKLAFLPIIMLLFGVGDTSKIIIIVFILMFPMAIALRDAIHNIPAESYDILTSLNASAMQKIWHLVLPAALPELFSTLRVAIGIALSALFFTESFGTDTGLGFYITDSWMRLDYIQMFFGILVLSFLGIFLFVVTDALDARTQRWKRSQ